MNGAWQVKAFRDYADYMACDEFKEGLDELLELAEHGRPAIMCSEAVPWRCHRGLISDALIVAGAEVMDIMSPTMVKPAVLDKHAHVHDGHLSDAVGTMMARRRPWGLDALEVGDNLGELLTVYAEPGSWVSVSCRRSVGQR